MEVRHAVRLVRHTDDNAGGDLLQHAAQGGLVVHEDARGELHGGGHARRHASEGARRRHGGVQIWRRQGAHRH